MRRAFLLFIAQTKIERNGNLKVYKSNNDAELLVKQNSSAFK